MTQIAQEDVLRRVRAGLEKHSRPGWNIELLDAQVRQEDDWWYVPVRPGNQTRRGVEYYDILAEVEGELQDELHLNVLLVPTAPDE